VAINTRANMTCVHALAPPQGHAWPAPRCPPSAAIPAPTADDPDEAASPHRAGLHIAAYQPQADMAVRVHCDHRMRRVVSQFEFVMWKIVLFLRHGLLVIFITVIEITPPVLEIGHRRQPSR
jgi:hypothetical protein